MGGTEILCSFSLVLEEKTCKEIPESSRPEFLGKFSANNFVLSDAEDNNSWPLNRGGIADLYLCWEDYCHFLEIQQSQVSKILVSEKINISKRAGLWESISSTRIGKHGVIQKFFVGGSSTTKCDQDCDQALKKSSRVSI